MIRQVVLDTETTGLDPSTGHRVIEIGCIEMIDRRITENHFHFYLNPEREIDEGAVRIHGLTSSFLQDKPKFKEIVHKLLAFIQDSELIIHNAPFDVGFLNHELRMVDKDLGQIGHYANVFDTLTMARQKHPGQKNNLDALCKRYNISNEHRQLHGALLDAQILAHVYLAMTRGQMSLLTQEGESQTEQNALSGPPLSQTATATATSTASAATTAGQGREAAINYDTLVILANAAEKDAHDQMLAFLKKKAKDCVWENEE